MCNKITKRNLRCAKNSQNFNRRQLLNSTSSAQTSYGNVIGSQCMPPNRAGHTPSCQSINQRTYHMIRIINSYSLFTLMIRMIISYVLKMNIQSYDTAVLNLFVVVGAAPKFEFNCHGSSGILLHRHVENVETSVEVLVRIRLRTKQPKNCKL